MMHTKKRITLITLSICFIVSLLSVSLITEPYNKAYALTTNADIALGGANNKVFAMESNELFVTISTVASQTQNAMSYVRSDVVHSGAGGVRTVQIEPYVGGCNAVDNPCGVNSAGLELFGDIEEAEDSNWIGSANGLWCGLTDCFTWWKSGNSSYPHQLQRWTIENQQSTFELTGYMNVTFSENPKDVITGVDTATGGIGGITVITVRQPAGFTRIEFTGGTSLMGDVGTPISLASGTDINEMATCHPALHDNCTQSTVSMAYDHGTTDRYEQYNIGTHTLICTHTGNSYVNTGSIFYNDDDGKFYVTEDTNNRVTSFTVDTCTETIIATVGLYQNYPRAIVMNPTEDNYFVYHASADALPIITQMDYTVKTNTEDFDAIIGDSISGWVSGANAPYQSMALDANTQTIMLTGDTSTARILYLPSFVAGSSGTDEVCIDTNGDGLPNVCYQDTNGDGIPDSSPLELIGASQPITTHGFNLLCQINVSEGFCDNPDIQTNGVGYLYWFGLFLLMGSVAYLVFGEKGKGKALGDLNIMVIITSLIASAFISNAFAWIDLTLPVLSIIIVCGFGAKQLVGFIEGRRSGGE